jgi:hypothetical protein
MSKTKEVEDPVVAIGFPSIRLMFNVWMVWYFIVLATFITFSIYFNNLSTMFVILNYNNK